MATRSTAQDTTSEIFENAEDRIGAFADLAYELGKEHAKSAVTEQKNAFRQFCTTVVRALRRGGDEFRREGYNTAAGLVDDVADKAEDFTDEIEDFDMRFTTERVEDFVRERPMIAYGALAIAGFVVANTLQSASRHRNERQIEDNRPRGTKARRSSAAKTKTGNRAKKAN
jgi:hypothetical protein